MHLCHRFWHHLPHRPSKYSVAAASIRNARQRISPALFEVRIIGRYGEAISAAAGAFSKAKYGIAAACYQYNKRRYDGEARSRVVDGAVAAV